MLGQSTSSRIVWTGTGKQWCSPRDQSLGLEAPGGQKNKVLVLVLRPRVLVLVLVLTKKSWEFSRLLWVWLIAGTKNNNLRWDWVLVLVLVLVFKEKVLVLVLTKKSWSWSWSWKKYGGLGLGLGLETQSLGLVLCLNNKVLLTSLPFTSQNDRVYAPVGTKKRFIQPSRLLRTRWVALDVQQVCYGVGRRVKNGCDWADVCRPRSES